MEIYKFLRSYIYKTRSVQKCAKYLTTFMFANFYFKKTLVILVLSINSMNSTLSNQTYFKDVSQVQGISANLFHVHSKLETRRRSTENPARGSVISRKRELDETLSHLCRVFVSNEKSTPKLENSVGRTKPRISSLAREFERDSTRSTSQWRKLNTPVL